MGEFYDMMLLMEQDEEWLGKDPAGIADRVVDVLMTQHEMLRPRELVAKLTYLAKAVRGGYLSRQAHKKLTHVTSMLKLNPDPEVWMANKSLDGLLGGDLPSKMPRQEVPQRPLPFG
jgi:hypothetical protein